jgi:hypothetical protein
MKNTHRFLGVVLALFLASIPAFSQGETGRISGGVTDQTGGAISGAAVTVTDVARGLARNLMTDAAGQYTAPNLIAGTYTVQATAAGFQVIQRQNIQVGVGADIRVDLTLQPGAQNQTVTVTGEAPTMNTTNAQTGGTLENKLLEDLPINGGSYRALVSVLPGVTKLPGSGVDDQSTNGGGTEWDNYMLDGLYDVSVWVNQATVGSVTSSGDTTLLPIDAIQEINLVSNPKAEFGYYPGTTIDVGLKSGTNEIHGSAWAFGRDTSFDGRNAFSSPTTGRAPVEFEQFGAVIGGPLKKNKLFYFAAFEGDKYSVGFPLVTTGPSTAHFAASDSKNSFPDAIADINSKHATPPPPPFNGVTTLSTLSLNIAGCDPTNANITSTSGATVALACAHNQFGQLGLFANSGPSNQLPESFLDFGNSNNGLIKIDYKVNEHHAFNAEFYMGDSIDQLPPVSGNSALAAASTQPWWENVFDVYTRTGRVVEIWTPNSNWLNEARVGYDFQDQPNFNSECQNTATIGHAGGPSSYLTTYGLVSGADVINGQQGCGFPTISISGFQSKLDNTSLRLGGGRDLQFTDNVSYSRGKHQFKWGYNLRKQCLCLESKNGTAGFGNLTFGSSGFAAFTGANPIESFLVGDISSEQILPAVGSIRNVHYNMMAAFFQDDWRVNSKLTFNLGIRWEGETPARDSGGQLGNFDPTTASGMVQSNQLWPWQSNFAPHIGVAYDISGKGTTVIRAGGSMASVYQSMISWTSLASDAPQAMPTGALLVEPDGVTTVQGPGNIKTFLANSQPVTNANGVVTGALPWTAGTAIFSPSSFVAKCGNGLASTSNPAITNPGTCTLYGAYPNYKLPYVSTWNLSVQHAFNASLTLNVAYVGTHGTNLNLDGDINAPSPGITGGSNELKRRAFYTAANNGFGASFPWFGPAVFNFNGGRSDYNGLQLTLAKRVTHGLTFTAGYTFSHALGSGSGANPAVSNVNDLHSEYGNMPIDFRNRFTLTTSYIIPGRKAPLQMLEGWTIVSNLTLMGSPAITASSSTTFDTSGTGVGLDRWNITGNPDAMSKVIGGAAPAPCYGVPNSKFAVTGCTTVAAGAAGSFVGTSAFVANMPAACIAGALADSPSGGGANNSTVTVQSTTSLATSNGYNGLAQLAELGCYFVNGTAITPPAQGTFGDMAPGMLRPGASGGFKNWDIAVHKDWKIKERFTTQFRAEFFNVINRTNYFLPSSALASPGQFGESFSTPDIGKGVPVTGLGGPRIMQLAVKILW